MDPVTGTLISTLGNAATGALAGAGAPAPAMSTSGAVNVGGLNAPAYPFEAVNAPYLTLSGSSGSPMVNQILIGVAVAIAGALALRALKR